MNLDDVLHIISIIAWVFFIIFAVVLFVRTTMRYGLIRAVLQLLSTRVLIPLLLVLFISFISAALVFVPPTQVGVIVSYISPGGVRPQPMRAGLHLIIPIVEQEHLYPIYWQTYTMSNLSDEAMAEFADDIRARTSDGQQVELSISVIYRIDPEQAVSIHIDWQDRYTEDFVRPVVRGHVRTEASQFTVQEVNSQARKDLELAVARDLEEEFSAKGIILDQFLVRDVEFTEQYAHAIEEKQVALEGIAKAESEAQQVREKAAGEKDRIETVAQGQKEKLILEAEGQAQAIKLEAQAQADALTLIGEALDDNQDLLTYKYIEKLSPNIRAMLVPNDTPLILPLQEMMSDLDPSIGVTPPLTNTTTMTETTALDTVSDTVSSASQSSSP